MPDSEETTRRYIRNLIADMLEINPACLAETDLLADHGADSLVLVEIVGALERTLGITVTPHDVGRMVDLRGVYAVVEAARPTS
ncbi:acyl carrier protein [Myceligenerans crystallogenes]|uniref:Carrier domain-containing protein n=1 Tax=Myceligenerans crystallogenes TaxID=316335 RepID=A0ABP4ZLJ0_9MICO